MIYDNTACFMSNFAEKEGGLTLYSQPHPGSNDELDANSLPYFNIGLDIHLIFHHGDEGSRTLVSFCYIRLFYCFRACWCRRRYCISIRGRWCNRVWPGKSCQVRKSHDLTEGGERPRQQWQQININFQTRYVYLSKSFIWRPILPTQNDNQIKHKWELTLCSSTVFHHIKNSKW